MSHTPVSGHPQGWEGKLADRASLPPVPGEERGRPPALYPEHLPSQLYRYHGSKGSSSSSGVRRVSPPAQCGSVPGKGTGASRGAGAGAAALEDTATPSSPRAYLRWACSLKDLLEDPEGVRLFQWFVREAGTQHADRLDFYFACQGLKQQWDPHRPKPLVQAIYNFLRKSQLTIPEDVRRRIKRGLKDEEELDIGIFDSMQAEVEALIKETTYLSFLKSDAYLQAAQTSQSTGPTHSSSSDSLSSSSSAKELYANTFPPLATLHEDEELNLQQQQQLNLAPPLSAPAQSSQPQRLTRELLMATQNRRLQPEVLHGGVFGKNYSVYSQPHLSYTAYCPASRQDSELQSMSSGRTDSDALSMSGSSIDGVSVYKSKRDHARHMRSIVTSAHINKDTRTHDMVIPRTFKIQKGQCQVLKPEEFAPLLIEKLEKVRREQENQEKLDRKLMENDEDPNQKLLAAALREKLQVDDDNDQDILDQHVSRVWSDLTPARSPGRPLTPPPYSRKIRELHAHARDMHSREMHPRDLHSTLSAQSALSADSGNVRDIGDASSGNISVSKSRSVPDYKDGSYFRDPPDRRCLSKKTLTDLTDSGVSVVSDTPPSLVPHQPHSRVLMWIQKGTNNPDRYGRRSFSRSSSAERPGQPMATDPQMPRLPFPHTPTQLDEARRRLEQQHLSRHTKRPPMCVPTGKAPAPPPPQEALMPPPAVPPAPAPSTVVMFTFLEEQFPYRTKIPAAPVTLKQFKEYLPKKGNYRYFFKTECEELENSVIQEEIFNDSDYLPLWEGKIMARVKNVE